jgi:plastocyanin
MTTRTKTTAIMVAAAAILIAPACGKSNVTEDTKASSAPAMTTTSAAPAPASPAPASGATITIDGNKYTDVTVPPGAQVTVVNNDAAEHSVTSDTAGAFDVEIEGKQQTTFTAPTQPGTYPFTCTYHPSMHGVLTVQ